MTPDAASCWFRLEPLGAGNVLHALGDWRLASLPAIDAALAGAGIAKAPVSAIDGSALTGLDSAGALALLLLLGRDTVGDGAAGLLNFNETRRDIIDLVRPHLGAVRLAPARSQQGTLGHVGRSAGHVVVMVRDHVRFLGLTLMELLKVVARPTRLRTRELAQQVGQSFVHAIPIVVLLMFLIGMVLTYLLALVTEPYGAGLFVVDGVTIGLCREIAPILVAILVAGRSGAAFTAELASMNLREEVDAIAVLGLSPFQVLVLPRLLALTVALPLLIFVGDVAGIFGSMVLARPQLDLSYATYIERTATALTPRQVIIGLAKAPLFAAAIAVIACHMGLAAPREARAVGISTTSTVVQSIVAVILIDAGLAILFAKLGW